MSETSERIAEMPTGPSAVAGAGENYQPLSLAAISGFVIASLFSGLVLLGGLGPFIFRYFYPVMGLFLLAAFSGPLLSLLRRRPTEGVWLISGKAVLGLLVLLGLGGLVSFSSTSPWIMPAPVWLLPIAALVLCWIGRLRIQASEGTLSGLSLTYYGFLMVLVFGLCYAAVITSITFAIRNQATQTADQFLRAVGSTDLYSSFLLGIKPSNRPAQGMEIRRIIEVEHNAPGPNTQGGGRFSAYSNSSWVNMMRMAGANCSWVLSASSATFDRGTYRMQLLYQVTTPLARFDLDIPVIGEEKMEAGTLRRQWHVDLGRIMMRRESEVTDEGKELGQTFTPVAAMLGEWVKIVRTGQQEPIYLGTIPAEQRRGQTGADLLSRPSLVAATGLGMIGAFRTSPSDVESFQKGLQRFREGAWLEDKEFYADPTLRDSTLRTAKAVLTGSFRQPINVDAATIEVPLFEKTETDIKFRIPIRIATMGVRGKPGPAIEADAVVVGPLKERTPVGFRVEKIILLRGVPAPESGPPG